MNLTAVQIANQYRRCGMTPPEELIRGAAAKMAQMEAALSEVAAPKAKRGMNGLERAYAEHLQILENIGTVTWWAFEPLRLRLAGGTYFKPDFVVRFADGHLEAHETKGFEREAAIVRFKVAAEAFPWLVFVMVKRNCWKGGSGWVETRRLNG